MSEADITALTAAQVPTGHGRVQRRTAWSRIFADSFRYFDPRREIRQPVMFVVWVFFVFLAVVTVYPRIFPDVVATYDPVYYFALTVILFLTLWFAHLSEAIAEARGRAQAESLREIRSGLTARKIGADGASTMVPAESLRIGDQVLVESNETLPLDGDVVEGAALIDESMMTGESAAQVRESGGDRTSVLGGTKVVQGRILVRITANPGHSFLDRLIGLVEGASRERTPNELALGVLLASLTLALLIVIMTFSDFAGLTGIVTINIATMLALFVALMPTTIGALLPAIGISGINRVAKANVIAKSGVAVEAAGDLDVLILDKTGTITVGSRLATQFYASPGVSEPELLTAALLSSSLDTTPEGRSIVRLAGRRGGNAPRLEPGTYTVMPFTAERRMSGISLKDGTEIYKGSIDSMEKYGAVMPPELRDKAREAAREGMTPLVIAQNHRVLGLVALKDVIKPGIRDRIHELKTMGIRTIMCTGDNRITAAAIARESGVDEFIAEAKPEIKLTIIEREKALGHLVAMSGDGSNDAPALAKADVGLAMNSGTSAAKEAGNMVDLDNDPTKLIEVVSIGKQLLITRGALTTFTITNDVAKYFAVLPAIFLTASGVAIAGIAPLNILGLANPALAVLSTLFFNAIVIPMLIPLALFGVRFRPMSAIDLLRRNLVIYGGGGLVSAFVGIKLIYLLFAWASGTPFVMHLAAIVAHLLPLGGL
ncbi:MAG: potassium-transporting ATPase subunit KdpB [Candidatus Thermoplasmatota archaeon]|nr:potassium-transporting ATPase subunit KdpB [Candidatus Thermoplasmatota archaeon]MCL5983314.1 potassium-transporting ATPase subunit KdpB [Candidatus Thermoplasmatota archaeon]